MVFTKEGNFSWGKGAAKAEGGKAKHQLRTHLGKKSTQKTVGAFHSYKEMSSQAMDK